MAYDKVVDSAKLDAGMTATANAIRAKTGGTGAIPWKENTGFADAVGDISQAEDLSAELAAQDALISALEEAVAGKAAGGGTAEPPNIQPLTVVENNETTILGHNERLSALVEQVEALPDAVNAVVEPLTATKNGTYEPEEGVSGFSPVIVNVPSSGGGGGVQIQTGEFTITSDMTQYALHGVPFTPKWFAVKGPDFGSAGVPRTVYWQKNSYTGETVTCSHKSTNASLTTVLTEMYSEFSSSGFIIKQYLQLPLVAGTYKWVAMTDE